MIQHPADEVLEYDESYFSLRQDSEEVTEGNYNIKVANNITLSNESLWKMQAEVSGPWILEFVEFSQTYETYHDSGTP